MNPKLIKPLIILAIALAVFLVGAFAGYTFCKSSGYRGVIDQQEKDADTVMKHTDKKEEVRKNVDTIIETKVIKIIDPSGCLDTDSPNDYLDGLFDADSAAQSGFN